MISSARDYIWVKPGGDIRIDGGIMPARDVADDGTWKVLRGEDVAFCLEGAYERCGACAIVGPDRYSGYTRSVDKVIIGSRWRAAARSLRDAADRAINDESSGYPRSDLFPTRIPESATIPMLYGYLMFDKSKLRSDASKFNPKMPMRADDVRDVFHDMSLLRAFHHNGTFTRSTQGYSSEFGGGYANGMVQARNDVLFAHSVMNWRPGFISEASGWGTARGEGTLTFVPQNNANADFRTVARYCLVEELEIDFTEYIASDGVTKTETGHRVWHHAWVTPPISGDLMTGGSMTDSMQTLATVAEVVSGGYTGKVRNGRYLHDDELQNLYGFDVTVSLKSVRAAVYLNDHTDFSNIGWRR